jgi:hypothetical protein
VSLVDAWDFAGGRTTFRFGAGMNWDKIEPTNSAASYDKRGLSATLGVTRVLGARNLVDLSLGLERLTGFLTEPYKVVTVGTTTLGTSVLPEARPSDRARWSAMTKYGHYFHWRGALKTSYRYYWDDWKIRAHTLEMTYDQRFGRRWIVTPRLRYYTQTAASFFAFDFPSPRPAMSADYRLSSFWSWLGGLGVTWEASRGVGFNLAFTYQDQTGIDRAQPPRATVLPPAGRRVTAEEEGEIESEGSNGVSAADMQVLTATVGLTIRF